MGHHGPQRAGFRRAAPGDAAFLEPHELPERPRRPAATITRKEDRASNRAWARAALHQQLRGSFTLGEGVGLGIGLVGLAVSLAPDGNSGGTSASGTPRGATGQGRGAAPGAAAGPLPGAVPPETMAMPGGIAGGAAFTEPMMPRAPRGTTIIPTTTLLLTPVGDIGRVALDAAGLGPGTGGFGPLASLGLARAEAGPSGLSFAAAMLGDARPADAPKAMPSSPEVAPAAVGAPAGGAAAEARPASHIEA